MCPYCYQSVVPKSLVHDVLGHLHELSSHLGTKCLIREATAAYFWNNISREASEFVKACEICQRVNMPGHRHMPHDRAHGTFFNEFVAMDLTSGMAVGSRGKCYILVMIDNFSRFADAALKDKPGPTVLEAYDRIWAKRYGAPKHLLSDQGSGFTNAAFV